MAVKTVTYIFSKECNWHCCYCNQANSPRKNIDEDILFERFSDSLIYLIHNTEDSISLVLTGGEPGLWSEALWQKIIEFVNRYPDRIKDSLVCTNGTAFRLKTFTTVKSCFRFLWHCSENMDDIVYFPYNHNDAGNGFIIGHTVYPTVVLTRENYKNTESFLQKNTGIKYLNIDLYQNSVFTDYDCEFSEQDLKSIFRILVSHADRISPHSILAVSMYLKNIRNRDHIYKVCCEQRNKITIDLTEEKIYHCCMYKQSRPLSNENLICSNYEINCSGCFNPTMYYREYTGL